MSEPYSGEPAPSGSEDMRWVQSALNDVLGPRLPVDGIMDAATRSAVRSFQQREGLPVDGIVGPDTREALLRARSGKTAPPPDGGDQAAGTTAPDTEWEGEESLESFWDTLGSWWGGRPRAAQPRVHRPDRSQQPAGPAAGLEGIGGDGAAEPARGARVQPRGSGRDLRFADRGGRQVLSALARHNCRRDSRLADVGSRPPNRAWEVPSRALFPGLRRTAAALPADVRAAGEAQSCPMRLTSGVEDGGGNCTGSFTQGAAELRQHLLANFRGIAAIGRYSCRQNRPT